MANATALLTIALLLCSMLMCTARPDPAFFTSITVSSADEAASITISSANEPCNMEKKIEEKSDDMDAEEENCGANDEDCLLRRTLVAHTDYIYTQKKKHN